MFHPQGLEGDDEGWDGGGVGLSLLLKRLTRGSTNLPHRHPHPYRLVPVCGATIN
jgi:hypothetical protein